MMCEYHLNGVFTKNLKIIDLYFLPELLDIFVLGKAFLKILQDIMANILGFNFYKSKNTYETMVHLLRK